MSSLLGVIHKSGSRGGHLRTVTTQAALVNNSCWAKQEETCRADQLIQQEHQKNYDEAFRKFLSLNSSLHELYKIDSNRMGSVSSMVAGIQDVLRPQPLKYDPLDQDADVIFQPTSRDQLLLQCQTNLNQEDLPPAFPRNWSSSFPQHTSCKTSNSVQKSGTQVRVFQWNVLAQAIGTKLDNFSVTDPRVLDWSRSRRWRLLEEVILHNPDIICLQEVDHFNFVLSALASIGYSGWFKPKPDSACKYVENNNGPDGVAIFYKDSKFNLHHKEGKVLEAWGSPTNQVSLALNLEMKETGRDICVVTTHLKARKGSMLANIRDQQGADLMTWIEKVHHGISVILTGDFNAEPSEPVVDTIIKNKNVELKSSYNLKDLDYTTWKIRDSGEEKHTLDYIFHSKDLVTLRTLDMPSEEDVGVSRLPSIQYASDHLSLVSDIIIPNYVV